MPDFMQMGKYASYIWSSYAIVGFVLAVLVVVSWRFMRAAERRLAAVEGARGPAADQSGADG